MPVFHSTLKALSSFALHLPQGPTVPVIPGLWPSLPSLHWVSAQAPGLGQAIGSVTQAWIKESSGAMWGSVYSKPASDGRLQLQSQLTTSRTYTHPNSSILLTCSCFQSLSICLSLPLSILYSYSNSSAFCSLSNEFSHLVSFFPSFLHFFPFVLLYFCLSLSFASLVRFSPFLSLILSLSKE